MDLNEFYYTIFGEFFLYIINKIIFLFSIHPRKCRVQSAFRKFIIKFFISIFYEKLKIKSLAAKIIFNFSIIFKEITKKRHENKIPAAKK